MRLKEIVKKSLIDYSTLPFVHLTKILESSGLRCSKCGVWGWRLSYSQQDSNHIQLVRHEYCEDRGLYPKRWRRVRLYRCHHCERFSSRPTKATQS